MNTFKISSLALAVALTACGGGGSSSGGNEATAPAATAKGIFTDSAVAGINYTTSPGNQSGKTNALGEYSYVEGDTVTFMIGGTALPPIAATGRVTPADMSDDADIVTNVLQLLQTLDEDGDPSNGITIGDSAHAALAETSLDVTGASGDFDAQAESAIGETLVSEEDAEAHFQESQQADLRGSWIFVEPDGESSSGLGPNGEEVNVLTFLNGGRYMVAHQYGNDDQGAASAEWGTYTWEPETGLLTTTVSAESDGDGGLGNGSDTVKLVGDELHLGSEEGAETPFQAVKDANNPNVGGWILEGEEGFHLLTILDDGRYVIAHSNTEADPYEGDDYFDVSSEWGTYELSDGGFNPVATQETDGEGGLYNADLINEISGDYYTLESRRWGDLDFTEHHPDGDNDFSMMRVGRFPVDLFVEDDGGQVVYNDTVLVERGAGAFVEGESQSFAYQFPTEDGGFEVNLQANGAGTVSFGEGENSTIDAPWTVNTAGTLDYSESMDDDSTGYWYFSPIRGSNDKEMVLVAFSHVDGATSSLGALFISELIPLEQLAPELQ